MVIRCLEAEAAHDKLVALYGLAMSGNFTKWDESLNSCLDWHSSILGMQEETLSFALNAQTLTLADPSNLRRWGAGRTALCPLCGKSNTTSKHILNGCFVGLKGGRYKWRHDNVLKCLHPYLDRIIQEYNKKVSLQGLASNPNAVSFVKAGEKNKKDPKVPEKKPLPGLLALAYDWQLSIDDITGKVSLPVIAGLDAAERPDIVISSSLQKIILWAELTVPLEENILKARLRKTEKYQKLAVDLRLQGWKVHDFTIEVGSIGYIAPNFGSFLRKLTIPNSQVRKIEKQASLVALRSSYFIWMSRFFSDWNAPDLVSEIPATDVNE